MRPLRLIFLGLALSAGLSAESPLEVLDRRAHPVFRIHAHRAPFPSDTVSALVLDHDGCLWAGTVAGLAKYDGRGWRPVALPIPAWRVWVNNCAMGVLEDGTLWVGTRTEGLWLHKDGKWTQIGREQGLPTQAINAVLESRARDAQGRRILYVATYGGGLVRRHGEGWEVFDTRQGLPSNQVFGLAEAPDGRLWVSTAEGVAILEGDRFIPFEGQKDLPDKDVRRLVWTEDADGAPILWIGPLRGGPCSWSNGRLTRHPIGEKGISDLIASRGGGVWVTFWGDGLARWDGHRWQTWRKEDGLPTGKLRCLAEVEEDGRSVLWIGTDGRGVLRTAEGGWRQLQPPWNGEVEVRTLLEGPDGATWIGGRNFGLFRFDGRAWNRWDLPREPITGDIRCLAWWHGQLWAGCDLEVLRLGPKGLEAAAPGSLLDRRITRCLAPTPDRLWIGTSSGLLAWDGAKAEAVRLPGGPGSGSVRSLELDEAGLWIGTDGGLYHRDADGSIQTIPGIIPGESSLALKWDGSGLWVGTASGRLLRWTTRGLQVFAEGEGRWAIQGLRLDAAGTRLFASTARGVECWDIPGRRLLWRATAEDGLPDDGCLPGGILRDAHGRVWVGTEGGLGVLDPDGTTVRPATKRLYLMGAQSASGPREPGALLPRGETWMQVEYALRVHHREEDTRYRTQLHPLESQPGEWTAEAHRRMQALPRGSYELRVWARDYQGQDTGPLVFPFRVTGRLWEHPAFLGLGSILLLGLGGFLARAWMAARQRELVEAVGRATAELSRRKEELERLTGKQQEIMGVIAHDIRNPLSGIGLMAELLEDEPEPEEQRKGLRRIKREVSGVSELLNQFLTLQSMEAGTVELQLGVVPLAALLTEVVETFAPVAAHKAQSLEVAVAQEQVWADPRILREVMANLLSNALKYSPAGAPVTLRVEAGAAGCVRIAVVDRGPGLTEQDRPRLFQPFSRLSARPTGGETSVGLGLAICKRWVEAMGGRIGADSEGAGGSTFWVELKGEPGA
ncbi:MAG TPA: ATP-binding protein [Holophagaceae bacterium]|nr:ATP-binding protein [Holophagaceae bacterium]